MVDGVPSLSGGLRGTWTIRHELGNHDGRWHLWPVVMPEDDPSPGGGTAGEGDENAECCVCYDRRIDVRLEPCGHVALCGACAFRLSPRRCPLCRADIANIVRC